MAKGLEDKDFNDCLKRGKIKKFSKAKLLTLKEFDSAKSDLAVAQDSIK